MHRGTLAAALPQLGRRMQRKVSTRQELLVAGRQLFSEMGLYESRVEDVTRTAGIAKGTLYLYFHDKEDLIRAVVTAGFEQLQQRVRQQTSGESALAVVVPRMVAAHVGFLTENPDLLRIFHQARGMLKFDRPRWRPLRVPLWTHLKCLAEILGQVPVLARLSRRERLDLAIQLFGAVSGVMSVRAATNRAAPADADARDLGQALAAAFRQRLAAGTARQRTPQARARSPRRRQVVGRS